MSYFSKFPVISYRGVKCLDISRRVKLQNSTLRNANAFYPFVVTNEQRPDTIAFDYYDDPNIEWIVYLTNAIIDPYYGWYMSDDDFNAYILAKYESIEIAQQKILFWRVNWSDDQLNITPNYYENNLPEVLKKYWTPRYGQGSKILSYQRRQEDWTQATNKLVRFYVTGSSAFSTGDRVLFKAGGVIIGSGWVVDSTGTYLDVQHLQGSFDNGSTIENEDETIQLTVSSQTLLYDAITPDEFIYWEPVTAWDVEVERNEKNKTIFLLEKSYFPSLDLATTKKLQA